MRTIAVSMVVAGLLVAVDAQAQRIGYGRYNQNNDFNRWDQPLQGNSQTPEPPEKVTYGQLAFGEAQKGHLDPNETHYFQFRLAATSHCQVDLVNADPELQLAFLDDATRVAALGVEANLKAGTYFLRLKTRAAADYLLTLQCSAP